MRVDLSDPAPLTMHPLSDPQSGDIDPSWSPDGGRIVFSSLRAGNRNLWTARPDLTGATPLTAGPSLDERPTYSPDGREIAFLSDRGGRRGVWLVGTDGGTPTQLATIDVIGGVSWAPDGRRLVASVPGETGPTLALISRDTGKIEPLRATGAASAPAWSPKADVIAYLENLAGLGTVLHTIDAAGKPVAAGFPESRTQFSNGFLSWSRDGRRLAAAALGGSLRGSLWIGEPSDPVPFRKLIDLTSSAHLRGIAWAPDGRSFLVGVEARSGDIVLMDKSEKK